MNIKYAKNDAQDFGVIRQLGTFEKSAEQKVVTLFPNIEREHVDLSSYDDSNVQFTDQGVVSVKERLSLARIMDNVKALRKEGHHNLTVDQYLKAAGYTKSNGEDFQLRDIYNHMGFDPKRHTLNFILNTSKVAGSRELVPEIIRGFIQNDLVQKGIWRNLIASERAITQPTEIVPHINYSGEAAAMESIGEATHVPLGSVSFGRKTVSIDRRGLGIVITDPVKKYVTVDQLGIYLRDVSKRLDNDLTSSLISVLQNGDMPNYTDPIGALGVESTADKIQYVDYLRLFIRYAMAGYNPSQVICNEAEALRQLQVAEFKPSGNNAAPMFSLNLGNTAQKQAATMWIHPDIADNQQMFIDSMYAAEYLVAEPLSIEEERRATIETTVYVARMTSGFSNLVQAAKVLLDGTQAFSSTGWPSYLTLKK